MASTRDFAQQIAAIEQTGVVVMRDITKLGAYNEDIVCPYVTLILNVQGEATALYNMQESTQKVNQLACIMPGHILHVLDSSDDYCSVMVMLSSRAHRDLRIHSFSHDYNKFNESPFCTLKPEQAQRMLQFADHIESIARHSEEELPHRYQMLLALLAIGYECINFYRREQDNQLTPTRQTELLNRFCDLVVAHYRESREATFYADLLHLTPKHFSRVIRSATNGLSPNDWIEQYVIAQAKHLMDTQPTLTIQETAYRLGFNESASFCRFFKRLTGLTPKTYKDATQP